MTVELTVDNVWNYKFWRLRKGSRRTVQYIKTSLPHGNAKDRRIRIYFYIKAVNYWRDNRHMMTDIIRFRDDEVKVIPHQMRKRISPHKKEND